MRRLLLTRPPEQSRAFAAALEQALPGRFHPVLAPLFGTRLLAPPVDLAGIAALAFTSANGVAGFAALEPRRDLPAFCVGPGTASAARAAGLAARSADGDARALAGLLAREAAGPVLHARGAEVAADLAALVGAAGPPVVALVVYEQIALEPPLEAEALLRAGGVEVAALFSPRGAARFAGLAARRGWRLGGMVSVAISAAADAPLAALGLARRAVADTPSRHGMLAALARV